jgi:hypothetical protein
MGFWSNLLGSVWWYQIRTSKNFGLLVFYEPCEDLQDWEEYKKSHLTFGSALGSAEHLNGGGRRGACQGRSRRVMYLRDHGWGELVVA